MVMVGIGGLFKGSGTRVHPASASPKSLGMPRSGCI
jgi:hypothetical protein